MFAHVPVRLFALVFLVPLTAVAQPWLETPVSNSQLVALVAATQDEDISVLDALSLFLVINEQPERIEALDEDADDLRRKLVVCPGVLNEISSRTQFSLAMLAYRGGHSIAGAHLFDLAIECAPADSVRADFYDFRGRGEYGSPDDFDLAIELFPTHGPSLYRRAGLIASSVGRQSSLRGRFAYWCLADIYRNVAASTSDSRIASTARRAAAQYERAAPSPAQYIPEGYTPGQSVEASLGEHGSCTTHVR